MKKLLPWIILLILAATLLAISFCDPYILSDENDFLHNFVGHQLLSTLGFILAITLASAANIHLELNRLESEATIKFERTRKSISYSAYSLIAIFLISFGLVIIKPVVADSHFDESIANLIAILLVYFNLSVLYDLTRTVHKIPPVSKLSADTSG
ncbi:hypothetical protein [Marinicauda salina]|uniref:hypothetical protein n=1 Tax=Marinicauda salina TaxID=2135793 RepID=UPI0011B22AC3|nr:hypothetical protein [Marinicauda salina]